MKGFVTFQLILFSVLFLGTSDRDIGFHFQDVAKSAGIDQMTISGAQETNRYLLEGTGCGAAFFDYNNDGWLDVFLVNASRLARISHQKD